MEISLVRHGESRLLENHKITFAEFNKWVEKYNVTGVFEQSTYPELTIEKVETANFVVTSDLERSIVSANLLNPNVKIFSDSVFREAEMPANLTIISKVKLKPTSWAVLLRLLWLSGYSNKCESLSQAKLRAKKATQQLISYANDHNSIVLVGHGYFNILIAKELKRMGWEGKSKANTKHWKCSTFSLQLTNQ